MDPESFLDIANQVTKLKMYPYFDIAHYIISCLYMREDLAVGMKEKLLCLFLVHSRLSRFHLDLITCRKSTILPTSSLGLLGIMHV